jgi:lysophospholipase L1-like esterase
VILLEGINDLGRGQSGPEAVIQGYKRVVEQLHARRIAVIGATLTPSLRPEASDQSTPAKLRVLSDQFGSLVTNSHRQELNEFIRSSGLFDSVADMEKVTKDPTTGAFYKKFQVGDYLHPNRAGHQAMADALDLSVLLASHRVMN